MDGEEDFIFGLVGNLHEHASLPRLIRLPTVFHANINDVHECHTRANRTGSQSLVAVKCAF